MNSNFWGQDTSTGEHSTMGCINWDDSWVGHVEGFRLAGEVLVHQLDDTAIGHQDFLVYPILFLYRHAVEIGLKQVIERGRLLLGEPAEFPDTHDLVQLWTECRAIYEQLFGEGDAEARSVLDQVVAGLHEIDPGGDAFRYPMGTKSKGRPPSLRPPGLKPMTNIPLRHVTAQVNEVVGRLDGMHTEIEECLDYKYEGEADARAEAAEYFDYEPDME